MAIKLSELFGSMDEAFNNPKLEEMFNKTKDVAENMSKKSAERLEISRKKVELLDAKAKLAKLYEKFGKLNYAKYIGDEISEDEIKDCGYRKYRLLEVYKRNDTIRVIQIRAA